MKRHLLGVPHSYFLWMCDWFQAGQPESWEDRFLWSRRPLLDWEKLRPSCGAHCKSTGQPCKMRVVYRGGRCRLHGGLSCGPYRTRRGRYHPIRARVA